MDSMALASVISLSGIASVGAVFENDVVQMILHAGTMVKFIMTILLAFSLVSWAIIFMKWWLFRRIKQETDYFFDLFWEETSLDKIKTECDDLTFSPVAHLFRAGYSELKKTGKMHLPQASEDWASSMQALLYNVERTLKKTVIEQSNRLEKTLAFLATTGNTSPFIGLFGTVWGIMVSFRGIGLKGSASLAVVAPGISEALVATAAGLAAAIPAVVAFNHFSHKAAIARSEMESFSSDFLNLVERQALKRKTAPQKA